MPHRDHAAKRERLAYGKILDALSSLSPQGCEYQLKCGMLSSALSQRDPPPRELLQRLSRLLPVDGDDVGALEPRSRTAFKIVFDAITGRLSDLTIFDRKTFKPQMFSDSLVGSWVWSGW